MPNLYQILFISTPQLDENGTDIVVSNGVKWFSWQCIYSLRYSCSVNAKHVVNIALFVLYNCIRMGWTIATSQMAFIPKDRSSQKSMLRS